MNAGDGPDMEDRRGGVRGRDAPTRRSVGLPPGATSVFGAFNDHYKVEPEVFGAWMRLLASVKGSVLWTVGYGGEGGMKDAARELGVDPERIHVSAPFAKDTHVAIKALADVFVDTPLYNAHSTLAGGIPPTLHSPRGATRR